jgi:energy-coupling factor transporter ATP-binding protein EcfA2
MPDKIFFQFNDFSFTYSGGNKPALKNISIDISEGEFLAVVGPNNSGKSTLCNAIAGLIPGFFHGKMSGEILMPENHKVPATTFLPSRYVGFVLQNPSNQMSHMRHTVFEEVAFGLENTGVPADEMPERIHKAISLTGISHLAERSPFTLSGGEQQRLAIASILAMDPQIIVFDEPTTMLDPGGCEDVFAIIQNLAEQGRTVIVAEHNLEWISQYANRVVALEDGEIILDGKVQDVMTAPRLAQNGTGRTSYTEAASLAKEHGIIPGKYPLPANLPLAVQMFGKIIDHNHEY